MIAEIAAAVAHAAETNARDIEASAAELVYFIVTCASSLVGVSLRYSAPKRGVEGQELAKLVLCSPGASATMRVGCE